MTKAEQIALAKRMGNEELVHELVNNENYRKKAADRYGLFSPEEQKYKEIVAIIEAEILSRMAN